MEDPVAFAWCADINIDGVVVIREETDPNNCACFGCDYGGYCELVCKFRAVCWEHCDRDNDVRDAIVILREL
jgi:hypothetical protein